MRWHELRFRAAVALRRRVPGGRALQRRLIREDLRDLRRLTPVSAAFGFDRGTPIDRWYIERFLEEHAALVTGRVLEVGDRRYVDEYGTGLQHVDVLHVVGGPGVTIVGDLATGQGIPREAYNCMIVTQTLNFIHDVADAVRTLHSALAPEGSLLLTVPGISPISDYDEARWGEHWRFTERSLRQLFAVFDTGNVDVHVHGNVLASAAFLYGLAAEELTQEELTTLDPRYPLLLTVRAQRGRALGERLV